MNLQQFFIKAADQRFWNAQPVSWFVYSDDEHYPSAFFAKLRKQVEAQGGLPVQSVQVEQGLTSLYAQLETSFLGSSWRYSVSCSAMDSKTTTEFIAYSRRYNGPHKLMIFVAEEYAASLGADADIKLDEHIDEAVCLKLAAFFGMTVSVAMQRVLRRVFKEHPRIPFASVCTVLDYTLLAEATPETEASLMQVLKLLLKPEGSLFTLSQLLFAQQPEAFYRYLTTVNELYPEQFWISFWSEQLYRAYFYVALMQRGNQDEAKKIGVRLPFSFLQRDWRRYSPQQLAQSHAMLYHIDCAIKNGAGTLGLDRFYQSFFMQSVLLK